MTADQFQIQRQKDHEEMRLKIIKNKAKCSEESTIEHHTLLKSALNSCRKSGGFYMVRFQNSENQNQFIIWKPSHDSAPNNTEPLFFVLPKKTIPLNDKAAMMLDALKFETQQQLLEKEEK